MKENTTTFESIMNSIYDKESLYYEILNNIASDELEADLLLSEFALYACNNQSKILESNDKNYLRYLFINIIKNNKHSNTSPYARKIRIGRDYEQSPIESIDDSEDIIQNKLEFENDYNKIISLINGGTVFDSLTQEIAFKMYYFDDMTYRAIGIELKVNHTYVFQLISKAKEKIKRLCVKK